MYVRLGGNIRAADDFICLARDCLLVLDRRGSFTIREKCWHLRFDCGRGRTSIRSEKSPRSGTDPTASNNCIGDPVFRFNDDDRISGRMTNRLVSRRTRFFHDKNRCSFVFTFARKHCKLNGESERKN